MYSEQLRLGTTELAPRNADSNLLHFLPHQPVLTPSKNTTKLRIIFDASAKVKHGESLNECLCRRPVIPPDLMGTLSRFRGRRFIVTADIRKAFLQISLTLEDREVIRFHRLKGVGPLCKRKTLQFCVWVECCLK